MSAAQAALAERFLALHRPGAPLLLPNPWDVGSARLLASLGFEALATTSGGFAATLGRLDGDVTREEALAHAALGAVVEPPASCARTAPAPTGSGRWWARRRCGRRFSAS